MPNDFAKSIFSWESSKYIISDGFNLVILKKFSYAFISDLTKPVSQEKKEPSTLSKISLKFRLKCSLISRF